MNSVLATTHSSVYLAMRHIFPEVPISAGAFEPLNIIRAHRHISGCALSVRYRAVPPRCRNGLRKLFSRLLLMRYPIALLLLPPEPAETSRLAVMIRNAGATTSCIRYPVAGTAVMQTMTDSPTDVPQLVSPRRRRWRSWSRRFRSSSTAMHFTKDRVVLVAAAAFGLEYDVEVRRGNAQASFVMDHGRVGPRGALGGMDGATTR